MKDFSVSVLVLELSIINYRMKLLLTVLLSSWIFGMILANNIVRKSMIFEKVKDISLVQGKWTAVTTIKLDPYYSILKYLQTELETVKNI